LMHDPTLLDHADAVVMESTYGDRDHPSRDDLLERLAATVRSTADAGGNVVIPTFAIDRAQELLYTLGILARDGRIPRLTVFLDSPMAINATTVYKRYARLLDEETRAMLAARTHPFQFPGLHFVRSAEESRSINSIRGSCIILAGSGMCTGGRVKHHLRHNIHRPESTILFSGYQARDTLGRRILEGEPEVRIHGRTYPVHARIERLDGISAHADRSGLLRWLRGFDRPPARVFLVHGEQAAAAALAEAAREHCGSITIPAYGDRVELFAG
ncbi:MAG: MBL fold metallo-hydrolase, partial [Phycisphaerae bacterium]|nr:MBL fold metallo-hydrolase [Phycisphaerae bacterium]